MKNPPKNININYVVSIYKDMKLADDIETSNSFESDFQAALKFYNETIDRVKNNQYVTLELEIEWEFDGKADVYSVENIRIADNYIEEVLPFNRSIYYGKNLLFRIKSRSIV